MVYKGKLYYLFFAVVPLLLLAGCGDLEPDMQDTRTVSLNMDFHGKSSSRGSSSVSTTELNQYNTHLILALPSWEYLTSSYKNFYSSFAQELMNAENKKVSLEIPLNTQMKIFAFLFKENYSLSDLFSEVRKVGYYGESQPFSIDARTNDLRLSINLIQVPGTGTDTDEDADINGNTETDDESSDTDDVNIIIDNTAPMLIYSPSDGANGIGIDDNITITFSEAVRNIDDTVLTNSNIDSHVTLKLNSHDGQNVTFDATINENKKVITIDPTSNLFYSQNVYVAIDATLEDSEDNVITASDASFTTTMDPSLEAFYPFNGNANDESGNLFHGQLGDNVTNSKFPTLTTDRFGNANKAFSFDGTNDYIALNKYVTYNSISEITVCAWVLSTDTTKRKFIISFDRSESFRLALNDDMNTYVGWDTTDRNGNSTVDDLGTPESYEDGNWHHICGWYNSSSTVDKKIFADGVMVASKSNTHSGRNLGTNYRQKQYGFIGWGSEASSFDGNGNVHSNDFMKGKIDDVRIYSRSLSSEEITALYLREKP